MDKPQQQLTPQPGYDQPGYDQQHGSGQQPGYGQPAYGQQPGYGQPAFGQQPGYVGYSQAGQMVYHPSQPQQVVVVSQVGPIRPSNYLALAVLTTICCNLVFGVIAIIFSVSSTSAADEGDMESAKTRGTISCAMSLIGILSTVIAIVVVVVYFAVLVDNINIY